MSYIIVALVAAIIGGFIGRSNFGKTVLDRIDGFVADLEKHAEKHTELAEIHDEEALTAQANAAVARKTAARATTIASTLKSAS